MFEKLACLTDAISALDDACTVLPTIGTPPTISYSLEMSNNHPSVALEQICLSHRGGEHLRTSASHLDKSTSTTTAVTASAKVARRRISNEQSETLQGLFDSGVHFPSREMRERLARQLSLTPRTVQVWFQNRRQASRNRMKGVDRPMSGPKLPIRWMKPVVFDQAGRTNKMAVTSGVDLQ